MRGVESCDEKRGEMRAGGARPLEQGAIGGVHGLEAGVARELFEIGDDRAQRGGAGLREIPAARAHEIDGFQQTIRRGGDACTGIAAAFGGGGEEQVQMLANRHARGDAEMAGKAFAQFAGRDEMHAKQADPGGQRARFQIVGVAAKGHDDGDRLPLSRCDGGGIFQPREKDAFVRGGGVRGGVEGGAHKGRARARSLRDFLSPLPGLAVLSA